MRANDLEELPIFLVAEASVEVYEAVRGAEGHYFILLIEGY